MSADNVIYIRKIDDMWCVWHDSASNDEPKYEKDDVWSDEFKHRWEAVDFAMEMESDIGYVEYGINIR